MMRTNKMQDGVFHLKDYKQAIDRYRMGYPVWGAWTETESAQRPYSVEAAARGEAAAREEIQHWVETPLGLTESQARQAVKVAVETKTGERVHSIVYDP